MAATPTTPTTPKARTPRTAGTYTAAAVSAAPTAPSPGPSRSVYDTYELLGKLGQGAFATVYMAAPRQGDAARQGTVYAVKVIDMRPRGSYGLFDMAPDLRRLEAAEKEIEVMRSIAVSANIVKLHEAALQGPLAFIVMERCEHTLLSVIERLPRLDERAYKRIFKEMLQGVWAVHAARITHRDIKPDNFMCAGSANTVKLCDFGLSARLQSDSGLDGINGTPPFMAPEMLAGRRYDTKVDMWALGVTYYLLLFGRFPYRGAAATGPAMKAAILSGTPPPSFKSTSESAARMNGLSEAATSLVRQLLNRKPEQRLPAAQVMAHEYFTAPEDREFEYMSLRPALHAAKRAGAFELRGDSCKAKSDLDDHFARLRDLHNCTGGSSESVSAIKKKEGTRQNSGQISDVSTEAGSDYFDVPCVQAPPAR